MRKTLIGILFFLPTLTFASTYGSNFLSGLTPTCDSDLGGSYVCANANDGNTASVWNSASTAWPHWFKIDTTSGKIINKVTIRPYADAGNSFLKDFIIQGSSDDSSWTNVISGTGISETSPTDQDFFSTSTTAYRYFRFYQNSDNWRTDGNNSHVSVLYEISAYECTDCSVATSSATSTIGFMSPQTDFIVQLFFEAVFVCLGILAGYLILKRLTGK